MLADLIDLFSASMASKIEQGNDHVTVRQPYRVRPLASAVLIPNLPLLGSIIYSRE